MGRNPGPWECSSSAPFLGKWGSECACVCMCVCVSTCIQGGGGGGGPALHRYISPALHSPSNFLKTNFEELGSSVGSLSQPPICFCSGGKTSPWDVRERRHGPPSKGRGKGNEEDWTTLGRKSLKGRWRGSKLQSKGASGETGMFGA